MLTLLVTLLALALWAGICFILWNALFRKPKRFFAPPRHGLRSLDDGRLRHYPYRKGE